MELLIVGAGAMGRWFGASVAADVAFADADPNAARAAAADAGGRAVPADTDARFDAVCLAVPISAVVDAVETYAGNAEHAMLDVTGVMAEPVAAMAEHAPDAERVSLHPLFAPENAPGNVAVVADEPGPVTDDLRAELASRGNDLFETTPAEHDDAMRTVQSKAHAAILAFALAADPVPERFGTPIYDGLADLVSQVAGGTPRVYAEIQDAFAGAEDVAAAAARIADADGEAFERLYREAGER